MPTFGSHRMARQSSHFIVERTIGTNEIVTSDFSVPNLIDYDDELLIVEMGLVTPPRVLDFGKAYLDAPADYPAEALADSMAVFSENYSSQDWERVLLVVDHLASLQIFYYDLRPENIQLLDVE